MSKHSPKISALTLGASMIVCLFASSCSLEKRVSVTTGRYENIPNRNIQPNMEIETSHDTVATYRF